MRLPSLRLIATVAAFVLLIGYFGAAQSQDNPAERVLNASPYAIAVDAELSEFVRVTAAAAIGEHCASCHGADLTGKAGVPNLTDYDWLWGVTGEELNDVNPIMAIQQTLLYGIRNRDCPEDQMSYGACSDTRYSEMPGYGVVPSDGDLGFPCASHSALMPAWTPTLRTSSAKTSPMPGQRGGTT